MTDHNARQAGLTKMIADLRAEQSNLAASRDMCGPEWELPRWDALQRVIDYLAAPAAPAPTDECGMTLADWQQVERDAAPAPAAQADRESALDQAMAERDAYQTIADGMAYGIAKRFGIDIGEHSNLNFPWDNALQILEDEPFPQSAPADAASEAMSQAARDVLAERQRQISAEGWTPEHDDKFTNGALSLAAGTYALHGPLPTHGNVPLTWPWDHDGWKPSTPRRNLVKAGALILAEIERMDRAANTAAIAANYAVNSQRAESIARAVSAHGRHWPEQLTSGVMFYEGERITKAEFLAALRGAEG